MTLNYFRFGNLSKNFIFSIIHLFFFSHTDLFSILDENKFAQSLLCYEKEYIKLLNISVKTYLITKDSTHCSANKINSKFENNSTSNSAEFLN